jgi:hypothetical protein
MLLVKGLTSIESQKNRALEDTRKRHSPSKPSKNNCPPNTEKEYKDMEHWFNNVEKCRK